MLDTSRFHFRKVVGALITLMILSTASCSTMHARLSYDFEVDPLDERIFHETGTEDAAAIVSTILNDSIDQIETAQFDRFKDSSRIRIYIFNEKNRHSRFMNVDSSTFGGATTNDASISVQRIRERFSSNPCRNQDCPETVEGILLHELSHVHTRQYTGSWRYGSDVPSWFHEGLATLVSGGAGAGLVSEEESIRSIRSGSHLVPDSSGRVFTKPGTVGDLRPGSFLFYRQSQMFVRFLKDTNPAGFQNVLREIRSGRKFRRVWESNYNTSIADLWETFTLTLQRQAPSP